MKVVRVLIAALVAAVVAVVALIAVPLSASSTPRPDVVPHTHLLVTPEGNIPVGPDVCGNPDLQQPFNQFHWNIHVGPANTAFDHTHNPVNIISGGLC